MKRYIPDKIKELIGEAEYISNNIGMSSSDVLSFSNCVLKIEERSPETENQRYIISWLDGRISVPEILAYVEEDNFTYTLMSKIDGKMLCDEEYMKDPALLYKIIAQGLKQMWSVDVSACPCTISRLSERLKAARYNVEHDLVDIDNTEPETFGKDGFKDQYELISWLENNRPEEDIVLTHGDFSLPNVFAKGSGFSGFIDLGKMGPADRWQDIAICLRSLKHNFDGKYTDGKKYPGFDQQKLLDELGIEFNEEKMKYYILLDELF